MGETGKMPACECCKGSGRSDVLDVWSIQRAAIEAGGMPSYDSFDAFPMLKDAIACPVCRPDDPDNMESLVARLGSPWKASTFKTAKH